MVIETITNLITIYPVQMLIAISAILTLITTLLMMHFTDQEHIKNLKKRQKELQKEVKEATKKGEHHLLADLNKEMMELSMKLMKASFSIKQLVITMVPFLIIFKWLRTIYTSIYGGWWILWYILASMVASTLYRKWLKMA
jgi:uncharacterized membrane protein (DUF106 family)